MSHTETITIFINAEKSQQCEKLTKKLGEVINEAIENYVQENVKHKYDISICLSGKKEDS